jgi:hypothetical protein
VRVYVCVFFFCGIVRAMDGVSGGGVCVCVCVCVCMYVCLFVYTGELCGVSVRRLKHVEY